MFVYRSVVAGLNRFENHYPNWIISSGRGENEKWFKPPTGLCMFHTSKVQYWKKTRNIHHIDVKNTGTFCLLCLRLWGKGPNKKQHLCLVTYTRSNLGHGTNASSFLVGQTCRGPFHNPNSSDTMIACKLMWWSVTKRSEEWKTKIPVFFGM